MPEHVNKIDWTDELLPKDEQAAIVWEHYERGKDVIESMRDKWDEWYKAYRSYFEMPEDFSTSELAIPMIFSDVEAYMPRLAANKPEIFVGPRSEDDRDRAGKHRVLITYQWDALKLSIELVDYVKAAKIYGTSIWKVGHRKDVRNRMTRTVDQEEITLLSGYFPTGEFKETDKVEMQPMTVWDGPYVEQCDLDEIIPDPDGWSVDSCEWIIHERDQNIQNVIASLEADEGIYDEPAVRKLIEWMKKGNQKDKDTQTLEESRKETFGDMVVGIDSNKREFTEIECWYDGKVVSIVKENPKLDPIQYRANPLGLKPFIKFCPIPLPKEFYGISLVEILFSLAIELNILHSARLDNLLYAAHRMFKILRTSNLNPNQLRFRPGGALYVDDMRDIEELQTAPLDFSLYRESDELQRWEQKAGGATDTFAGLSSQLTGGTATEANLLAEASGTRAGLMFKLLSEGALHDLGKMFILLNEIYMSEEQQLRVTGDMFTEDAFETVAPEDLANRTGLDLDFTIDVASAEPGNRGAKLQRANGALSTFGNMGMPLDHPLMERTMLDLAEGFGFDNAQFLITEGRKIIEAQRAAELAAQQSQAPGNEQVPTDAEFAAQAAAQGGVPLA